MEALGKKYFGIGEELVVVVITGAVNGAFRDPTKLPSRRLQQNPWERLGPQVFPTLAWTGGRGLQGCILPGWFMENLT